MPSSLDRINRTSLSTGMSKLMKQLTAVRELLRSVDAAQADSFSQVFSTFLDLTETTDLVDASKPVKDKGIRSLIEVVARRHANDPALGITDMRTLHYAPAGLFHGGFFAGADPGTFFYFMEEKQGLVAFNVGRITHYYRITATELPPGTVIGRKRWSMN